MRKGLILYLIVAAAVVVNLTPNALGQQPTSTPEMIARRVAAFAELRKVDPYRDITDPVAWEREIREDVAQPGRE